jgi:hypothetical protein
MTKSLIYRPSDPKKSLRQGEILTGVIQFQPISNLLSPELEKTQFQPIIHNYAIIISQDCDLDWDYQARQNKDKLHKLINSVIFCEVYTAQEIRFDKILNINSSEWNLVKSNRHQQYHFFEKVPNNCELIQAGLPELTVDFKKVFGIDAEFLYHQISKNITKRRTILQSPYLEHFSHRYHDYHGRIALPAQYESEKGAQ